MQPKARPTNVLPSRYASLPSTSPPRHHLEATNGIYIGKNIIGIGISAVHDAVLKGGARMPGELITLLYFSVIEITLQQNIK